MRDTDELLEEIGHVTRDHAVSPDAMRWSPEPPPSSPPLRPAGVVPLERVVVELHYADGLIKSAVAHHPQHAAVSVDTEEPEHWSDFGITARFPMRRLHRNLVLTLEDIGRLEVTTATAQPPRPL